jgi:TPP-dependent pyruvate/acetoin dehydrogenase alpha subunit
VVDGHDFFAVYEVAGEAIKRAREGGGPTLVECKINRYYGHFEGDAQTYRSIDEVKNIKENKDCLMLFAKRVTEQGLLTQAQLDAIDKEVAAEIEASVVHAKSSAKPTEADLLTDVYVSYP